MAWLPQTSSLSDELTSHLAKLHKTQQVIGYPDVRGDRTLNHDANRALAAMMTPPVAAPPAM